MAQGSAIVDDKFRVKKDLWDALDRAYQNCKTQMVTNIESELENLTFGKDGSWEQRVKSFHSVVAKLESSDNPRTDEKNAQKFIPT